MSNTLLEVHSLLYAVLGGALIGLVYDLLLLFRTGGKAVDLVVDLLFWAAALVIALATLLHANYLQLRLYTLVGLGAGGAAYFYSVSVGVRAVFAFLKKWILRGIQAFFDYLE